MAVDKYYSKEEINKRISKRLKPPAVNKIIGGLRNVIRLRKPKLPGLGR